MDIAPEPALGQPLVLWRRSQRLRLECGGRTGLTSTAELNAIIERVAPAILELLANGMPRSKAEIIAALAARHDRQDVISTLMRLTVTGELEQVGSKYKPATAGKDGPPEVA